MIAAGVVLVAALAAEPEDGGVQAETVVTATRDARPLRQVPTSVTVVPRAEIQASPSLTVDSLVRGEPGAQTFRASTSLVADPSSQGVNLRGVGPSGVSRTLVLLDGVPVNDPFGGWVFWRSLPRLGLDRVEIAPGPGSALYGSGALGGVIQLFSRPATPSTLEAEASGGSFGTVQLAGRASQVWSLGSAVLEAGLLRTDGFRVVSPAKAGAVDGRASSDDVTLSSRFELAPSDRTRLGLRLGYFSEEENGGTPLTLAKARMFDASITAEHALGEGARLVATAFTHAGEFDQTRSRVAPDRSTESLAGQQVVPLSDVGASAIGFLPELTLGGTHRLSLGVDFRRVQGTSTEEIYPPSGASFSRVAGGEQQLGGLFVQDTLSVGQRLELLGSVRADGWRNLGGTTGSTLFPERDEGQLSPRGGVLFRPLDWLALRVSGGTGFRAPTLNELYRPFQVGAVLTAPNPGLVAERITGGEAGVEIAPRGGLCVRATGFLNRLDNPVTNATLATPLSDGSTRQRENLGAARIQGVETSVALHPHRAWTVLAAYTWVDARVLAADRPALVGKRLPLDPQHRASASVMFSDERWFTALVQVRALGPQFEDDLNTLPIASYAVVDLSASRRLGWGVDVFVAVENLLNQSYVVGRAGLDTYGQPLLVRGGLRFRD